MSRALGGVAGAGRGRQGVALEADTRADGRREVEKEASCLWSEAWDGIETQGDSEDNGDEKRICGISGGEPTARGEKGERETGPYNAEA